MKIHILLPISITVSLASFAFMNVRVKDLAKVEKNNKFLDVKLRVTLEVLEEYKKDKILTEGKIEALKTEQQQLQKAITEVTSGSAKEADITACEGVKKTTMDEVAALRLQEKSLQEENAKAKTAWEAETANLKANLEATSPICEHIKAGSALPSICPEKKEEPKPEAPKPEEKKAEPPKPEEKKAEPEPPKPEEKKAEPPKPEEKKAEPPKPEEKKAEPEPPKPEEKKAEPEPPKQEAPKPEAAKQEPPKQEAPKAEAPKQEAPK